MGEEKRDLVNLEDDNEFPIIEEGQYDAGNQEGNNSISNQIIIVD